jgi:hypothetical protein
LGVLEGDDDLGEPIGDAARGGFAHLLGSHVFEPELAEQRNRLERGFVRHQRPPSIIERHLPIETDP